MDPNYVVGRGKLYFTPFLSGTRTLKPGGSRYLGNSPELALSQDEEKLDHYSSDAGIRVKDASVSLQNDMSGTFSLDDIQPDNLALWFRGEKQSNVLAAVDEGTHIAEDIVLGSYIQLGLTAGNPIGARNVSDVTAVKAGTQASGTLTLSTAVPAAGDTVTVDGVEFEFVVAAATPYEVTIAGTINATATALADAVNAVAEDIDFSASAVGAVVTFKADATGTAGNTMTLAKNFATAGNGTVSGATLAGGSASGTTVVTPDGNFEVDAVTGRVFILEEPDTLVAGDDLTFTYDAAAGTEELVIAAGTLIEGRLEFFSDNAAGANRDYIWPCVQIGPDGDFSLKGDDWQTMSFTLEILKLNDSTERQYIVKR